MKNILALTVLILLQASLVFAADKNFSGFVQINKERQLFVNWDKAQPGQPTVVLLNGLTYSTVQWERFAQAFA
jgi:alpha-beta hydrolase superfamily lysophospholipase